MSADTDQPRAPLLSVLRNRRFLAYWIGQSCSRFGTAVAPVALTLAVIAETKSATSVGIILATGAATQVLLLIPAGVWMDRLPRRPVMAIAEAGNAAAQVFAGIELVNGIVNVGHLALAAAVSGAAGAFYNPAVQGLIPAMVEPGHLIRANALIMVTRRVATLAGPAVGTTIVLTVGAGWALLLDSVTFAVSAITLASLRVAHHARPRRRFGTELAEGWAEVRRRRWYWTNLIGHSAWNLARCAYVTVGPLVVIGSLGGQVAWGAIVSGGAVGGLAGSVVALWISPKRPLVTMNLVLALGALPLVLIGAHAHPVPIVIAAAMMATALGLSGVLWDTVVQQSIPAESISRVSAYGWLSSIALTPIGMAVAGPLATALGSTAVLFGAAALVAVCCLGVLLIAEVRDLAFTAGAPDAQLSAA